MLNPLKQILPVCRQLLQRRLYSDYGQAMGKEKSVNHVTLLGRCGQDPVIRDGQTNRYAIFSLCTDQVVPREGDDPYVRADWHKIISFMPSTVKYVSNYVQRGDRVMVQGSIGYQYKNGTEQREKIASIKAATVIVVSKSNKNSRRDEVIMEAGEKEEDSRVEEDSDYKELEEEEEKDSRVEEDSDYKEKDLRS